MSQSKSQNSYAAKEEGVFFDDGREEELVAFVEAKGDEVRNSPKAVLKAIDEFGRKRYLMNVGEDKGRIVEDLVRQRKPKTMVELGGYCGYSTILFGQAMKEEGGEHYYCLERSPKFAKNIEALVKMAGLDDVIKVVVGASNESIQSLYDSGKLTKIDMMFLDHYKPAYTTDLKLCEQLSLIHEGSVLAADNCIAPGNPPYIAYVESTPAEKRKKLQQEQKTADTENFNQRSATQYGKVEDLSLDLTGNPNIIYESKMIHSYEPTGEPDGIMISTCTGFELEK